MAHYNGITSIIFGSWSILVIIFILGSHSCQSQPFHGRLLLKLVLVLGHSYFSY